jgi:hypothetical protein
MAKSISEWIHEGEELHAAAVAELAELESQLTELEQKRTAKLAEVNQIAGIIGKPPAEPVRRLSGQIVEDRQPVTSSSSSATIARALAGKGLGR